MANAQFDKILASVEAAALNDVVNLTSDRIEALAGGHGMVNMSLFSVANVIAEELMAGASLEIKFANQRHLPVEDIILKAINAAKASGADGANAARRTTKLVQKYFAFDPLVTVEVIEDGKRAYMEHFTDQVIPDVCFGKRDDVAWAVPVAAPAVSDLALSGCCILNIVVPASVAALMEYSSIADASEEAERAAYITGGIPGGKASAMKVAEEALAVYDIIK